MAELNIFPDKILYNSAKYVAKQLHLQVVNIIADHIGKKGYIFKDKQGRLYFYACKRKMCFSKGNPGIISFSKEIVKMALGRNCILLMYIEDLKPDGNKGNYIYMFDPKTILFAPESWTNTFNEQEMLNFHISYCINAEPTRMKEFLKLKYDFELISAVRKNTESTREKGTMTMSLLRYV